MAGTVYILLALTVILTISNTSAESQDVGVTKAELDKVSEALSDHPEKLVKFCKKLAYLFRQRLIENKPKLIKDYLETVDALLKAPILDDKPEKQKEFWKEMLDKLFKDQLKTLHGKTTTQDVAITKEEGDKVKEELLNHPKELKQFLQYMSVFLNEIENTPKVLKDFLEKLGVLLKGVHDGSSEEAQKKSLKKLLDFLFDDEFTTTASTSTKKPASTPTKKLAKKNASSAASVTDAVVMGALAAGCWLHHH